MIECMEQEERNQMPLLIPSDDPTKKWNRTPKSYIRTRCYRINSAPPLGKARAIQREAYDWALKTMDANPDLKVRDKNDCLWSRLTRARRDGTLPRAPLCLQRAAVNQAHAVFNMLEEHWQERIEKAQREQDEKISARLLKLISIPPKPITAYLRSHPSKQHRRQSIAVLEGVTLLEDGRTIKMRGVGTMVSEETIHEPIRSGQLVYRKGQLWLHAQHGEKLPEPKALDGKAAGYDAGIIHTLTSSEGEFFHRPDTTALQEEARNIQRHRKKCCTYKSRQWRRSGKEIRRIRKKISDIQQNWERHTAKDISQKNCVVGLENLQLPSMTASAKGTSSMPGSSRKKALNERLARSRIARFQQTIIRACLHDGTWVVMVNPKNTSIQCHHCKEKDKNNRDGEQFLCTKCGFAIHADQNAGKNIRTRAQNVMTGYGKTRGGRVGCPGSPAPNRQGLQEGHEGACNTTPHSRDAPVARQVIGLGTRPGCADTIAVKPSI